MTKWEAGMPAESYVAWLNTLKQQNTEDTLPLIPGVVVELPRGEGPEGTAERVFRPLQQLGLFPFQGERLWVETGCADWEQAEQLPHRLARLCVGAAGLGSRFRGGVVVDLRWCRGEPQPGCLAPLEYFLLQMEGDVRPLILTAVGAAAAVCRELSALDMQRVTLPAAGTQSLQRALEGVETLSREARERVLSRARESTPEAVRAVTNTLRRLQAAGASPIHEGQLLAALAPAKRRVRQIGFGREAGYGSDE